MNQQTPLPLTEEGLTALPVIARATSEKRGSVHWTVLTIYGARPLSLPDVQYIAEIVGETRKEGEVRRVRRAAFPSLKAALDWNMFSRSSALYQELRQRVVAAIEPSTKPAVQRSGFVAPADRPLEAALQWLYWHGLHTPSVGSLIRTFADDFGIEAEHVRFAIDFEAGETGDHQQPHPGNQAWINAFIASLAFFDREAFHANRETRRD